MSGRDGDVPHYCAHPGARQARTVPVNALDVSGRTVRLTADRLPAHLPGVTAVTRQGAGVALATTDVGASLRALLDAGVPLTDLDVRGASLEDAVVSLTTSGATR